MELDSESVGFLAGVYPDLHVTEADFLKLDLGTLFPGEFALIGNYPYNISSQIFFKVLDNRERIPVVAGMLQKEVAERICTGPGSKVYGILSVLLQAWYDCEYLFSVEPSVFAPRRKCAAACSVSPATRAPLSRLRSGALPESGENRLRTASQNAPQLSRPAYTPARQHSSRNLCPSGPSACR